MSKLIQMRQRIKAIETIRKITQAMRLISMSSHSRLKHQQEPLVDYLNTITSLFSKVYQLTPEWHNPIMNPTEPAEVNPLIILVSSQKGLCASFNSALFKKVAAYLAPYQTIPYSFITVGKKAENYIKQRYPEKLVISFATFNARNFLFISQELMDSIEHTKTPYSSVLIFSNLFKSFFLQQPDMFTLIPFDPTSITSGDQPLTEGYIWDQDNIKILDFIARQYLRARLQYLLFQSLLAEHAARFISMDSSTRNANNLLKAKYLEYNKLRQAKITTELTELSGSF